MKELQYKNLKSYRERQWKKQNKICPILKQKIELKNAVLDHKHKRKNDLNGGPEGFGLIRGVLHFQANVIEGKIARIYKRYGLEKFIDLPSLLKNLADYLENPPIKEKVIHPTCIKKKKLPNLGKLDSKRVFKYWYELYPKRKLPVIPKSGKITKEWEVYIQKANALHEKKTGRKLKDRKNTKRKRK